MPQRGQCLTFPLPFLSAGQGQVPVFEGHWIDLEVASGSDLVVWKFFEVSTLAEFALAILIIQIGGPDLNLVYPPF